VLALTHSKVSAWSSLLRPITSIFMASTFEIPIVTPVNPSPVPNPTNKQTNMLQQDLSNFHKAHLSLDLHQHFTRTFLQPQPQVSESPLQHEPEHPSEEEEDDLGYYPDGTKRTLTSAQVDMFRFSEIQSLLSSPSFSVTRFFAHMT